jgi:hypothetical protein
MLEMCSGMVISLHVKCLLYLSDFTLNGDCSTSFNKIPLYRFHEDTFSIPSDGKNERFSQVFNRAAEKPDNKN